MQRAPDPVEYVARYALGDPATTASRAARIMPALGLCTQARAILVIASNLLKEGTTMPIDPGMLAELIALIKDVIEKARRDRLIDLVNDFFSKYNFVLRSWTRMPERHEECFKKDNEVNKHLQDAKNAAKAGDANAMQEALAKAADDLEELAECLGIQIMPM